MNLLLDTHVILWWLFNSPRLSQPVREAIANPKNPVYVSSASAWEIATKHRLGKLPEAKPLLDQYDNLMILARFKELPITKEHALMAGQLDIPHRDPFDRMLLAQALIENLVLVSSDRVFRGTGVNLLC